MLLPVAAASLDVVLVCFRVVNRAIFTLEGSLWGFSHAFCVKKLPNVLVYVAFSFVSI